MTAAGLAGALTRLGDEVVRTRLPLRLPSADEARTAASQVATQLKDYILPRLADIEAPLLAVVGGSTGAGKSTLVNSLVGRVISPAGVIRPTTKSPVLVTSASDEHWFADGRILPGLVRTTGTADRPNQLRIVVEPSLPEGLAILDAPDIDSIVAQNRELAAQLLDAADLWLFVTSAARYSDAVPWEFLTTAQARSAAMAVILDRVPPQAMEVVPHDLRRLMDAQGLAKTPIFTVPETAVDTDGLLPDDSIAPVRSWLAGLAADASSRRKVVLQTLDGAVGAVTEKATLVANAADEQMAAVKDLQGDVEAAFREAGRQVSAQASDGSLLRGEVLARWHEYVGSTALGRLLDEKVSWLRDKLTSLIRGRPDGAEVKVAAEEGLRTLIVEAAEQACGRAGAAWQAQPTGRALLEGHEDLARASATLPAAAQRSIQSWQSDVLALVASEGAGKRQGARIAAAGVNGIGAALMLVIFASTGGITGAEIGVAGGTTVIAQRLLESIFGDEAVRKLAATAKANLIARIDGLLAAEQARYLSLLDGLGVAADASTMIDAAIDQVRAERASGYETPNPPPDPRQAPVPPVEAAS